MVYQYPKEASDQGRKKIEEGEQPGEHELLPQIAARWCRKPNGQRNQKRYRPDREEGKENPAYVSAIKGFGFWNSELIVTHLRLSHRRLLGLRRLLLRRRRGRGLTLRFQLGFQNSP